MKDPKSFSDPWIQIRRKVLANGLAEFRIKVADQGVLDRAHALALALADRLAEHSSKVQVTPHSDGSGFEVLFETDKKDLSKLEMGVIGREAVLDLIGDD